MPLAKLQGRRGHGAFRELTVFLEELEGEIQGGRGGLAVGGASWAGHCGQGGRTVARELWAGRPAVGGARASQEKPRISSTSLSSAVGRQEGPISESTSDAALIHGGPCHRALKIISTQD